MAFVAVYGSLKRGYFNHDVLSQAEFIDSGLLSGFKMYDLSLFPGIKPGTKSDEIWVEVYRINEVILAQLDALEGYDAHNLEASYYRRERVASQWGPVYLYLYNGDVDTDYCINDGLW